MTKQVIWAIEQECEDPYYGWEVFQLYARKEDAEIALKALLEKYHTGYRIAEWELS